MTRRHIGLGLGIAVFAGATLAAPPASAATMTEVTRDGVSVTVTHVDGAVPTADKHPRSRYDIDGDGRDEVIVNGYAGSKLGTYTLSVRLSRTGAVERFTTGDTSLGRSVVADFDGDGFGDLAVADNRGPVGSPQFAGGFWVFYGGAGGFALDRTDRFTQATDGIPGDPTQYAHFGSNLSAADLDGDGRAELIITGTGVERWILLLKGTDAGLTATGLRQITPAQLSPAPSAVSNFSAMAVGDITGDGHPDLAVGVDDGRILVVPGSATGPLAAWSSSVRGGDASNLMVRLSYLDHALVADVNGDGFGDLIASASQAFVNGNSVAGAVVAFYGSAHGLSVQRRTILHEHSIGVPDEPTFDDGFGTYLSAGDVTGDGIDDLMVGTNETTALGFGTGALYVFRGSAQGLHPGDNQMFTQESTDVPGAAGAGHYFGQSRVLDLDGTGPLDVLTVATYDDVVAEFHGGSSGLTAIGAYDTSVLMAGGVAWPMLPASAAAVDSAVTAAAIAGTTAMRTASSVAFQQQMAARPVRPGAMATWPTLPRSSRPRAQACGQWARPPGSTSTGTAKTRLSWPPFSPL